MRTNLILLVVVLVLGVFTGSALIKEQGAFTEYDSIPRLFPGFTDDNIQYILVSKAKPDAAADLGAVDSGTDKPPVVDSLVLVRNGDGWMIGETPDHRSDRAGVLEACSTPANHRSAQPLWKGRIQNVCEAGEAGHSL